MTRPTASRVPPQGAKPFQALWFGVLSVALVSEVLVRGAAAQQREWETLEEVAPCRVVTGETSAPSGRTTMGACAMAIQAGSGAGTWGPYEFEVDRDGRVHVNEAPTTARRALPDTTRRRTGRPVTLHATIEARLRRERHADARMRFFGAGHRTRLEAAVPSPPAYPHQNGARPDSDAGRRQGWSDPRNPYTTAKLLITRHAGAAEDCAAAEMAHAQAVGDAGSYDSWAEIYDAIAVLQASRVRTSVP